MGRLGRVFGASWAVLGAFWSVLGSNWSVLERLGGVLERLGRVFQRPKRIMLPGVPRVGPTRGGFGAFLGPGGPPILRGKNLKCTNLMHNA